MKPDIVAELKFYSTEEGGRANPISYQTFSQRFGCLLVYKEETFDCFVILSEGKEIYPGERVVLSIMFLRPELIKPNLKVGDNFKLRELGIIAEGKIVKISP